GAELHEEAGEVDAQVVQAARRPIVDSVPRGGRRGPSEAITEVEPAIGRDRRQRHAGDAEHAVDGEALEHGQAASGKCASTRTRDGLCPRRASRATSPTTATMPPTAPAARPRRPGTIGWNISMTGSKMGNIAAASLPPLVRGRQASGSACD